MSAEIDRPAQIIDLAPRIRQRKIDACEHRNCDVDTRLQSLVCRSCGREVDPWWFLRLLAQEGDEEEARTAKLTEEINARIAEANSRIVRLNDEVAALTEKKNRLWNERMPDGKLLGESRRKRRSADAHPK